MMMQSQQQQNQQQPQQMFMGGGLMQQQQSPMIGNRSSWSGNNGGNGNMMGSNMGGGMMNFAGAGASGAGGDRMQQNRPNQFQQNNYPPRQPPQPFEGQVTRIFESFCIMNGDIYVSKAVAERHQLWPPQLGESARVHVVPHRRGRNNWKAVSYMSHNAMMMMSGGPGNNMMYGTGLGNPNLMMGGMQQLPQPSLGGITTPAISAEQQQQQSPPPAVVATNNVPTDTTVASVDAVVGNININD